MAERHLSIDSADWIAEVSHELRLPIANIKLLIETLLGGALEDHVYCHSHAHESAE